MNLFKTWKIIDAQQLLIRTQWVILSIIVLILFVALSGWRAAENHARVFVPPALELSGGLTEINSVPLTTVYAFAFQIFSAINTWPDNGDTDYKTNLIQYQRYFTASMFQQLEQDAALRLQQGALNRKRVMAAVAGMGFDPTAITALGNGVWLLDLKMDVLETVGGTVVKHVIMDYPLRIERVEDAVQVNPWGLVIAGFARTPYRIKTIV